MTDVGISSLIITILNIVCSYRGLKNHRFLERYSFEVDKVLIGKEYKRLITSGFLHVSWLHLVLNMASLCFFSASIALYLGDIPFLLIYFASLLGGNLFSLFIHRRHGNYSAVGASGAVSGIIFASIALFPGLQIGFLGISFPIAGWLYGLLYVLFSIYGIKSRRDNIGHEAHLGGGIMGLLVAILMEPAALADNYAAILAIIVPCILFIYVIITKPDFLLIDNKFFRRRNRNYTIDHLYNIEKMDQQKEIDLILEKIHQNGISSLSKREKEKLYRYSKMLQ